MDKKIFKLQLHNARIILDQFWKIQDLLKEIKKLKEKHDKQHNKNS